MMCAVKGDALDAADVVVRPAERSLAPVITRLHREAAITGYRHIFPAEAPAPTFDELLVQWNAWLDPQLDHAGRTFVALVDETVAGVVRAGPDPVDAELGHIARLYVDPARWRLGIGRALYRTAMDHVRGAGFTAATLWVLEGNDLARAWYERLGWQLTGERKSVYAPTGVDDLRYSLFWSDSGH